MTDIEELLEMMKEALEDCRSRTTCRGCKGDYKGRWCQHVLIADHLIANGVTVQRWIPVTELLPEKNITVIAVTDNGIVFQCLYAYDGWDLWEGNEVNITHWMPLPTPPKDGEI